jgi:hypothetical protein
MCFTGTGFKPAPFFSSFPRTNPRIWLFVLLWIEIKFIFNTKINALRIFTNKIEDNQI